MRKTILLSILEEGVLLWTFGYRVQRVMMKSEAGQPANEQSDFVSTTGDKTPRAVL